jgi:molybdopterin converting factor small subunit
VTRPVRLHLFATAREAVGARILERAVPDTGSTIGAVLAAVIEDHPRLGPIVERSRLVHNGEYIRGKRRRVVPGDEIAIHPPYSGG